MVPAADAPAPETKKAKKKKKKQRKLEEVLRAEAEHRAALARAAAPEGAPAASPPKPAAEPAAAAAPPAAHALRKPELERGLRDWLRPISRGLDSDRSLAATKASVLIAVNCLMLSLTAHALFGEAPG